MRAFLTVLAVSSLVVSCSGSGGGGGGGGGSGGGGGGGGGSGGGGGGQTLDCAALLQCAEGCMTDACEAACRARATPTANAQADAIVQCNQAFNCEDSACLSMNCRAQLEQCAGQADAGAGGGTGGGTGTSGFPSRYVGTVSDVTDQPGGLGRLESIGQVSFVRDDQADPSGQTGMIAFYRLESVTYTATASGMVGSSCTQQANQTVSFTAPPALGNSVGVALQPDANGAHTYDVVTTLTQPFPNGLTLTCTPGGTSTTRFNAELNVATGTPRPTTTTLNALVGSGSGGPGRTWSWNLQGQ